MHILIIAANLALLFIAFLLTLNAMLKRHLHILQLEDYEPLRMWRFIVRRPGRLQLLDFDTIVFLPFLMLLAMGMGSLLASAFGFEMVPAKLPDRIPAMSLYIFPLPMLYTAAMAWRAFYNERQLSKAKKKLALTSRANRLFWTSYLLSAALLFVYFVVFTGIFFDSHHISRLCAKFPIEFSFITLMLAMYFIERAAPLCLTTAVGILTPFENITRRRYLVDAKRILSEFRPLVIGITGSYGKTGTKEILAAMLARRYNVYRPPGSYNTLMGVTRAVREGLRQYHEVFIVEMGAYRRGSIAKLCSLVKPQYGLITVIGKQHLERFGSQQAILQAKGELIQALPPDGVAVLNGDDPLSLEIGAEHPGEVRYFKVEPQRPESASSQTKIDLHNSPKVHNVHIIHSKNLRLSLSGTDFDIYFPDGEIVPVHLSLLGRSAVANATAAAALADRLGVARRDIAAALAEIPPVKHRLEPRLSSGGIFILDNAFNSNPIGARDALEVLALASSGRRILVTPGMIELGELEIQANYDFGRQAAISCDLAVLVGAKHIEPIRKGLLDGGFPTDNIWIVPTLNEGLTKLEGFLKSGDTMLLENDLPDQYAGL